jgi:flagellar hook assembly protein FlgD
MGGGWYRLAEGAAPVVPAARSGIEMLGNAPNPFNPETRIRFRIPPDLAGATVRLVVLNTRGQRVRELVDGTMGAGLQEVTWDGRNEGGHDVASGIYLYRLEVGNIVISRKMLLLR